MPSGDELDTVLMTLVEAALERDAAARQNFLETVRIDHPELYGEVLERVAWEERMGNLLREPVLARGGVEHPFQPGELIASRFRIIRELGRGGMGVVYEAADRKLDRTVAIKCAPREFQSHLTPEARAALEVSHPNVCKLHEIHTAETASGPVDFLTMEFIEGETLAKRLKQDEPLSRDEAREIALQVCAGIAQAHHQNVVHGDIKPGNVILARRPEGGLRAVVTDFGLATLIADGNKSGTIGGTRYYMAPEMLEGARASVATDIYALGVLFSELFRGKTSAPESTLPRPWNKVVARCLRQNPEERFASVDALIHALTRSRALIQWAMAAALAMIAVLAAALWISRLDTGPPVRLAVLPISVRGPAIPAASGLGGDVADRLNGARRNFSVIGPQEAQRNHADSLEKARSVLGATHVLRTELRTTGQTISATATIADAASGQTLRELKGEYPAADTALIAKALIATVTRAFGLRARVPKEPTSGPAYQDYVQGLALIRRDDVSADEAIPHFTRASQLDPRSALPYAGLALAQLQKFTHEDGTEWLDRATETAAKARSINPDAAPVLVISGAVEMQRGHYEQAIAEFTRATQLEPSSSDPWRNLAQAYEKSNRTADAAATYRKAIETQPGAYQPYLLFGTFYFTLSQFAEAEEQYRHVVGIARNLSTGHMNLGLALMKQGKYSEAEREMLTALGLTRSSLCLMNLGALYYEQERFPEAVRFFEETIANGAVSARQYRDLGDGYRHTGRAREAQRAYREGFRIAQVDVARNPRQASARATLAILSALLGDMREAAFETAQALEIEPQNNSVRRNVVITYEILGDRENALKALASAPPAVLMDLNRHPDLQSLRRDPRFHVMIAGLQNH